MRQAEIKTAILDHRTECLWTARGNTKNSQGGHSKKDLACDVATPNVAQQGVRADARHDVQDLVQSLVREMTDVGGFQRRLPKLAQRCNLEAAGHLVLWS